MTNKKIENEQIEKKDANAPVLSVSTEKKSKDTEKKKKVKKEKKVVKKCKEISSELKKVSWPTFKTVVKKTGIVLAVVLIFGAVLLGIDYLLGLLFGMLN